MCFLRIAGLLILTRTGLDNLPVEVQHHLAEIRDKENRVAGLTFHAASLIMLSIMPLY